MEISITQKGKNYVGEFTVTEDFNLHVEKSREGYLLISQRTTEFGEYASLQDARDIFRNKILDIDIQAVIYPKHIRIVSEVPVEKCTVTYNS